MHSPGTKPGTKPTVFVVEDDEAVRNALLFLFSTAGLAGRAFASAEDFLAAQPAAVAGCIVLDIHLPGMSGLDLIDKMPKGVAALPVICVTGDFGVHRRAHAHKMGAFAFVQKPLADHHLLHLVHKAIERSLHRDCPELRSA